MYQNKLVIIPRRASGVKPSNGLFSVSSEEGLDRSLIGVSKLKELQDQKLQR
jgi:hypothetical protein